MPRLSPRLRLPCRTARGHRPQMPGGPPPARTVGEDRGLFRIGRPRGRARHRLTRAARSAADGWRARRRYDARMFAAEPWDWWIALVLFIAGVVGVLALVVGYFAKVVAPQYPRRN